MLDIPPSQGSARGPEGPRIHTWWADAELGWVPTTLLDPYRRADNDYELYQFVTSLVAGVFLAGVFDWLFTVEETRRLPLGMFLVGLAVFLIFLCWRLRHFRIERDERWDAIEKAKTRPTSETGPRPTGPFNTQ